VTDEQINEELEELVIGRALHALDEIDADVADDPAVLEYHEVLAYLPFEEVAPPRRLEGRVLAAARAARAPEVPSLSSRRRTARIAVVGAAAAVAAAVTLVIVNGAGEGVQSTSVEAISSVDDAQVARLERTEGARIVDLTDDTGRPVGKVVITPDGEGAVYEVTLPERADGTYWFWLSDADDHLAVAPVDVGAGGFTFEVDGEVSGAAISFERTSAEPSTPGSIVASGTLGD
jgi:hypothetical protein